MIGYDRKHAGDVGGDVCDAVEKRFQKNNWETEAVRL